MTNDIEIISRKEAKERGLKRYFTGKPCKHGHFAERTVSNGECCDCQNERMKEYRNQNKDKISEYHREYRKQKKDKIAEYRNKNKDRIAELRKEWYDKNKDKRAEWVREYNNKNKDKILEQKREHYKQNPAPYFLRKSLNRIFSNWKGGRKKVEKLHGYTFEQLVARIEFQFKDGMSWDNRSEWHIDHKKPISRFLEQGITDPKIVNALSNLRPMWASENLSKSNKWEK